MATPEEIANMPISQARQILERLNQLTQAEREYETRLMQQVNKRIAPELAAIDKEYANRIEAAEEAGNTELAQTLILTQKKAKEDLTASAIQSAVPFLDAQLAKENKPTSIELTQQRERADQLAPIAEAKQSQYMGQNAQAFSAEQAMAARNKANAERDLRVAQAFAEAKGDPAAEEALLQRIESDQDPNRRNRTMSLVLNLGFQPARPVEGVDVGEMGGGGGYAVMRDGTYRVDLPDGSVTTAASEAEAKQLIADTPAGLPVQPMLDEEVNQRLSNFIANTQQNIAAQDARVQSAFGEATGIQPLGPTPTPTPEPEPEPSPGGETKPPEVGFSLKNLDYLTNRAGTGLVNMAREFVTGDKVTDEQKAAQQAAAAESASGFSGALKLLNPAAYVSSKAGKYAGENIGSMLYGNGSQPAMTQEERDQIAAGINPATGRPIPRN